MSPALTTMALALATLSVCSTLPACGGATVAPQAEEPTDSAATLFGSGDNCPMLLACHEDSDDSCSEPFFEFRGGSDALRPRTVALLEILAAEIKGTPQLRSLRIEGHAAPSESDELAGRRANRIRDWLIEAGVSDRVLDTQSKQTDRDGTTYASLDVRDCQGQAQYSSSKAGSFSLVLF